MSEKYRTKQSFIVHDNLTNSVDGVDYCDDVDDDDDAPVLIVENDFLEHEHVPLLETTDSNECNKTAAADNGVGEKIPDSSNEGESPTWEDWLRRVWTLLLFIIGAIVFAARNAMPVVAQVTSLEYGWNKTQTGTVLSSFFAGQLLTQIIGGYVSDRFGAELVMISSGLLWSTLTFSTPFSVQPWPRAAAFHAFIVIRFITGCVQGFHFPAQSSLLAKNVSAAKRASANGLIMSGTYFGVLAIGGLSSFIIQRAGWPWVFYTVGLAGLVCSCTIFMFTCLLRRHRSRKSAELLPVKIVSSPALEVDSGKSFAVPWLTLFRHSAFWAIIVGHFCGRWTFFILFSWLPTYFSETFPEENAWIYNTVPWIIAVPAHWVAGGLSDCIIKRGHSTTVARKVSQTVSFAGSGIFVLLMCFVRHNYVASLLFSCAAITFCAFHRTGVSVSAQDIAPKFAGSVFGLMNTAGSLPGVFGVFCAGYLLQTFSNNWNLVFITTTVNCLIGGLFFMMFGSSEKIV